MRLKSMTYPKYEVDKYRPGNKAYCEMREMRKSYGFAAYFTIVDGDR